MSQRTISYRPDVDGLRAISVLTIIVYHLNPNWLRGGFVAVEVFFVISGFLLTAITIRELQLGKFSLRKFYGRRVRRLFPALLVVLPITLGAGALVMSSAEFARLGKHVLSASTYFSNFTLWSESGYFDADSETKPLLHLWTLAVEEHFYLLWPLLAWWLFRRGSDVRRWIFGLGSLSLVASLITIAFDRTAAFYFSPLRFWEILFGGCLAMWDDGTKVTPRQREFASYAGAAALVFAMLTYSSDRTYPGLRALLPVAATLGLVLGGIESTFNRWVLSNRVIVWIGVISYPLYLWHWPIIVFGRLLAPFTRYSPTYGLAAALAAIVLGDLTHRMIEKPAIKGLDPLTTAWRLVVPWLAMAAVAATVWACGGFYARYPEFNRQMAALDHNYEAESRDDSCPEGLRGGEHLHFCRTSKPGVPDAAVFGDSHAGHLLPGLAVNDPARNWLSVGSGSCPPTLDLDFEASVPKCRERSQQVLDYLTRTKEIRIVVLSYFGEFGSLDAFTADHKLNAKGPATYRIGRAGLKERERYDELAGGIDRMIDALEAGGKSVIFAIDTPEFPFFPRECVARPFAVAKVRPCVQLRLDVDRRQAEYLAMVDRIRARHPRLEVFDLRASICDSETCYARRGADMIYRDGHHLTYFGSELVTKGLGNVVDRLERVR